VIDISEWFLIMINQVGMVQSSSDLYAIIPNLEEDHVYQFRVCAVNQAGRSEMSLPSQPVRTKRTRSKYVIYISYKNTNDF